MGRIISSRRTRRGILFEVEVDYQEATILSGHYDDAHLFTEKVAEFKANISSRGNNSVTKYFLIPKSLRRDIDFSMPVSCQKIVTKEKIIFIYVVDKNPIVPIARK